MRKRIIGTLKYFTRKRPRCSIYLNPLDSEEEDIVVRDPDSSSNRAYIATLLASGFRRIPEDDYSFDKFRPCPLGTFTNSSSKGTQGCTQCPPGGFYSDVVGHVAKSCKQCPTGSFVSFEKAPGTQKQDCKSCPEGTETDFFAGYRACKCLEGFYRTDMFDKCYKCVRGLGCEDDYASLVSGYWWEWRNKTYKDRYNYFIKNLLASSPTLDVFSIRYPFPMPTPYKCPIEGSCKGGLDSHCEKGYEGPLCAVCSSGHYKQLQTCQHCPTKTWMIGQLSIIVFIVLIIATVAVWTSKIKFGKNQRHSFIDMFFSKLKIVIGFYQVTYGLLEAFSYIKWPDSLQVIGKYSEILQINALQVAPINCLFSGLHVDAFGNLFATMAINASLLIFSAVAYGVLKVRTLRNVSLGEDEKLRKLSQTKEVIYKNLFFFLYVTYLSTCSKTANVLPPTCRKLCRDREEEMCSSYLKADYSIQCETSKYNHLLILAYISVAYVIAIPTASFIALWRHRRVITSTSKADASQNPDSTMEMITGLRFLFENYKARSWYWELVEMSRKVILTSGLILVGRESRSYIGLAWVMAGMYGMLFSWNRPIQDVAENRLMATSLAVTVVNLGVGAVSRIPAENIQSSTDNSICHSSIWLPNEVEEKPTVELVLLSGSVSSSCRFPRRAQWHG